MLTSKDFTLAGQILIIVVGLLIIAAGYYIVERWQ